MMTKNKSTNCGAETVSILFGGSDKALALQPLNQPVLCDPCFLPTLLFLAPKNNAIQEHKCLLCQVPSL